jgi:hypothetical protein
VSVATSIDVLRLRHVMGRKQWQVPKPYGPDGWSMVSVDGQWGVIVTCAEQADGSEWLHASIAGAGEMPSYEQLAQLHRAVFGAAGWSYQVFAPRAEHISIHDYALHLWGRLDGRGVLPNFRGSRLHLGRAA